MTKESFKVGELAARTGVSVRTLHYYDEIGLLRPSGRTLAGHRLYDVSDVARLHQIRSLQQIGLRLEGIADLLAKQSSPLPVIEMHIERLQAELEAKRRLLGKLDAIALGLRTTGAVSVDLLLRSIEVIQMTENWEAHYTPEQLETLQQRRAVLGDEGMQKAQADWQALIGDVRAALAAETDPASPEGRALAARWDGLIRSFTGGDSGIQQSLGKVWQGEPRLGESFGISPEMMDFIARAREHGGG